MNEALHARENGNECEPAEAALKTPYRFREHVLLDGEWRHLSRLACWRDSDVESGVSHELFGDSSGQLWVHVEEWDIASGGATTYRDTVRVGEADLECGGRFSSVGREWRRRQELRRAMRKYLQGGRA